MGRSTGHLFPALDETMMGPTQVTSVFMEDVVQGGTNVGGMDIDGHAVLHVG